MHMRMSLRARAEAYEVAMPLLGPPEKLQLLNGTCTLTLVAPVSSGVARPLKMVGHKYGKWSLKCPHPLINVVQTIFD